MLIIGEIKAIGKNQTWNKLTTNHVTYNNTIQKYGVADHLDEPEFVEIWIQYFAIHDRTKKLKDKQGGGEFLLWHTTNNGRISFASKFQK